MKKDNNAIIAAIRYKNEGGSSPVKIENHPVTSAKDAKINMIIRIRINSVNSLQSVLLKCFILLITEFFTLITLSPSNYRNDNHFKY